MWRGNVFNIMLVVYFGVGFNFILFFQRGVPLVVVVFASFNFAFAVVVCAFSGMAVQRGGFNIGWVCFSGVAVWQIVGFRDRRDGFNICWVFLKCWNAFSAEAMAMTVTIRLRADRTK